MIVVYPYLIEVKFSDGSSMFYSSFTEAVKAMEFYTSDDLVGICSIELFYPEPPPILEDY